jgi:ABC-type uncharacterized transport system fused permease/ATPase subunit
MILMQVNCKDLAMYCPSVRAAGKKSSEFYQIFLDKDAAKYRANLLVLSAYYCGTVAILVTSIILCQGLSILWRARLTRALHTHYFHSDTFFHISSASRKAMLSAELQQPHENEHKVNGTDELLPLAPASVTVGKMRCHVEHEGPDNLNQRITDWDPRSLVGPVEHEAPDNPDQRITDEVKFFCESLSIFLQKCSDAPIQFLYYSYLCCSLFGSLLPVAAAVVFFIVCAAVHRSVIGALAAAVYAQEKAEGDFRSIHTRLRDQAASIAAWNGARVEHTCASLSLNSLLKRQLWLVLCYSAQQLVAKV